MRGYNKPYQLPDMTIIEEEIPVGCKRCRHVWHELTKLFKGSPRINGPSYCYDYCDKCITPEEKDLK